MHILREYYPVLPLLMFPGYSAEIEFNEKRKQNNNNNNNEWQK